MKVDTNRYMLYIVKDIVSFRTFFHHHFTILREIFTVICTGTRYVAVGLKIAG
jgi:hypothetical protein